MILAPCRGWGLFCRLCRFYFTEGTKLCPEKETPFSNLPKGSVWLGSLGDQESALDTTLSRELRLVQGSGRGSSRREETQPTKHCYPLGPGSSWLQSPL